MTFKVVFLLTAHRTGCPVRPTQHSQTMSSNILGGARVAPRRAQRVFPSRYRHQDFDVSLSQSPKGATGRPYRITSVIEGGGGSTRLLRCRVGSTARTAGRKLAWPLSSSRGRTTLLCSTPGATSGSSSKH